MYVNVQMTSKRLPNQELMTSKRLPNQAPLKKSANLIVIRKRVKTNKKIKAKANSKAMNTFYYS